MLQKISYLGNNLFQLDDSTIPLETEDIKRLAMDAGKMSECQAKAFLEKLESSGEADPETTAATGVVVNVYEVDYAPPKDPNLETQQLGSTVRENRDFITQYLFPSTNTQDVIVGLRKDLEEHGGGDRMPKNKKTSLKGWRKVLSYKNIDKNVPSNCPNCGRDDGISIYNVYENEKFYLCKKCLHVWNPETDKKVLEVHRRSRTLI